MEYGNNSKGNCILFDVCLKIVQTSFLACMEMPHIVYVHVLCFIDTPGEDESGAKCLSQHTSGAGRGSL